MKANFLASFIRLTFAFLLLLTVSASALDKTVVNPEDQPDDTRKFVRAVNPATTTIEVQTMFDQAMHHYKIDLGTDITVNKAAGKFTDIKVGMEVRDFIERDPTTLDSITLAPGKDKPVRPGKRTKTLAAITTL